MLRSPLTQGLDAARNNERITARLRKSKSIFLKLIQSSQSVSNKLLNSLRHDYFFDY